MYSGEATELRLSINYQLHDVECSEVASINHQLHDVECSEVAPVNAGGLTVLHCRRQGCAREGTGGRYERGGFRDDRPQ